jgi:hypothetical protein
MTTSEMRAALVTKFAQKIHFLLAAAQNQPYEEGDVCDECLVHARELAALATPSVASPQGTCKRASPLHPGDTLHARVDACVDWKAAAPVGEPGRTPQLRELAEKSLSIDYGGEEKPPDGSPWAIRYTLECGAAIRLTSKANGQMARAQIRGMLVDFANRAAAPPAQGALTGTLPECPSQVCSAIGPHRHDKMYTRTVVQGAPTPVTVEDYKEFCAETALNWEHFGINRDGIEFANWILAKRLAAQGAPGTREAQLLAEGLADVAAGRIRSLEEIKDSQKYGYLLEDMNRAHGFLRGRRMPLNMEENEAMHRDLAIEFAEVRADEAKYIRSPEEAKARIAALAQPGAPTKEGSDVTRS